MIWIQPRIDFAFVCWEGKHAFNLTYINVLCKSTVPGVNNNFIPLTRHFSSLYKSQAKKKLVGELKKTSCALLHY